MSIRIEQVSKLYQGVPVVNDVTIEIQTGEFFVLLGPSGSGKSTLLRSLAGLTSIDHGRISLHGRDVTALPARRRGVGMVFQHYALFRHMTVAQNIEFALRVRRVRSAERRRRREELLQLVALEGYDERYPSQLSGGQQQRVAVARALAHEPAVLLLDEPFGALDAKIRVELRDTVRAVQRRIGMTTILVTHDQEEAFALADRLGVMQMGRLLEIGTPEQLYRYPATRFVARFLGAANLLLAEVTPQGLQLGAATLAQESAATQNLAGSEAVLVVRPEDIEIAATAADLGARHFASGKVSTLTFAGHQEHVSVELDASCGIELATARDSAEQSVTIATLRSAAEQMSVPLQPGTLVSLGVRRVHALPTPISSFNLVARSVTEAKQLEGSALLTQLVTSMQAQAPTAIAAAVARGARRVLCIPIGAGAPQRMLVHAGEAVAHADLLALVSSVMRHLPIEATAITLQRPQADPSEIAATQTALLDTRAQLRSAHGLDLRSERFLGELPAWLAAVVAQPDPVLMVLAMHPSGDLAQQLTGLCPLLFRAGGHTALLFAFGGVP
jgi:sulfate transport system ATP-binding protein